LDEGERERERERERESGSICGGEVELGWMIEGVCLLPNKRKRNTLREINPRSV